LAAEAMTVRGLALAALERVEECRHALERSLELDPAQPMAAKVLAAVYFSRNETGRGLRLLRRAAELDPTDFRPWYGAGDVYRRLDRPEDAAGAFRRSLEIHPGHPESLAGLAWALLGSDRPDQATPVLEQALRGRPDDPGLLALAARHARDLGRSGEAIALADRCLANDPERAEALILRGGLLMGEGRAEEAMADAERAASLSPNDPAALHLLATVEARLGLSERSEETSARRRVLVDRLGRMHELTDRIEAHPDDPEPRWRLGLEAIEAGERTLAERSFRAALAIDPDCRPAAEGLAQLGVFSPTAGLSRSSSP
jgi:tetratricopeptide (TPR) repeat protein